MLWVFAWVSVPACNGPKMGREAPPMLTREMAIQALNDNADKLVLGLRSRGMSVLGQFLENGKRRRFDFRGVMRFGPPHHFWLEMQQIGEPVMQLGANDEEYWAWVKMDVNKMWAGHRASLADSFEESAIPMPAEYASFRRFLAGC